jgi:NADH dehydrogenase FAD-containing subunit
MTEENAQRRVVIVGGGFAGLFAVRAQGQRLGDADRQG